MLIRFEAANHRSIAEPVELSMVAVDRDRAEVRDAAMLGEGLLTVAAVFGPNASGKSNVVSALAWVCAAVAGSVRTWDDEIPVEPFAFGGTEKASEFVVEMLVDGVRFEYLVELDGRSIRYEALFHYPERKRRRVFERDGMELKLQRGLGALSGTRELLTERTLVLSVARRFGESPPAAFARELMRVRPLGTMTSGRVRNLGSPDSATTTARWFEDSGDQLELFHLDDRDSRGVARHEALALLRLADLGVEDVVIDEYDSASLRGRVTKRQRVRLVHRVNDRSVPLEFHSESEGTRTWFHLIGPVLAALRQGSLILFDELDASLHPTLSAELIKLFHSPVTNPRGAQLLFTSHDTSLLNHLNRDEVWLTDKREDGSTRLGALAEFAGERVRKSQNLANAYLHGRFGALPQVDQTEFLRALGLIG